MLFFLESNVHDIRQDIHTILAHMKDQQTSWVHMPGVHMLVLNSNTNTYFNSISNEVRNAENFRLGYTTSTNTSHSLLSFNSSQQNYNEDNYNVEFHEPADNKENDGHSNLKRKATETSSCAQGQGAHQTKNPRNDEILYNKYFPVQRRNVCHIA